MPDKTATHMPAWEEHQAGKSKACHLPAAMCALNRCYLS